MHSDRAAAVRDQTDRRGVHRGLEWEGFPDHGGKRLADQPDLTRTASAGHSAALTVALKRAYHRRSLTPSYLARGWQCVGSFARADFIDVHAGTGDDVTVVFRSARRTWRLIGRGKVCEDGEIPARIWYFACAVN